MLLKCTHKFWLEDPKVLFCTDRVLPLHGMNFEQQMNALTRLILIICIILYVFNFKYTVLILLITLLLIIILYYVQRNSMTTIENYNSHVSEVNLPKSGSHYPGAYNIPKNNYNNRLRYCGNSKNNNLDDQFNNPSYVPLNEQINTGKQTPNVEYIFI